MGSGSGNGGRDHLRPTCSDRGRYDRPTSSSTPRSSFRSSSSRSVSSSSHLTASSSRSTYLSSSVTTFLGSVVGIRKSSSDRGSRPFHMTLIGMLCVAVLTTRSVSDEVGRGGDGGGGGATAAAAAAVDGAREIAVAHTSARYRYDTEGSAIGGGVRGSYGPRQVIVPRKEIFGGGGHGVGSGGGEVSPKVGRAGAVSAAWNPALDLDLEPGEDFAAQHVLFTLASRRDQAWFRDYFQVLRGGYEADQKAERERLAREAAVVAAQGSVASPVGDVVVDRHCVVHVHGLHHSGTGLARLVVHAALSPPGSNPRSSLMVNTTMSEDEGQHAQTVFPRGIDRGRDKSLCLGPSEERNPRTWGRLWYCPKLARSVEEEDGQARTEAAKKLWEEWSPYWDLSVPYLIQKSPILDVLYLDRLDLGEVAGGVGRSGDLSGGGTFHVVVMRHPFLAHPYDWSVYPHLGGIVSYEPKSLLFLWLDVWAHLLELFSSGLVKKFAVVQYEVMANEDLEQELKERLGGLIRGGCGVELFDRGVGRNLLSSGGQHLIDPVAKTHQIRRRLEYHPSGPATSPVSRASALLRQQECENQPVCEELMNDLAPVVDGFGYDLTDLDSFRASKFVSEGAPGESRLNLEVEDVVLFSYERPPNRDLVKAMKGLVDKYIDHEW